MKYEMGWPQPRSPLHTDNSTASGYMSTTPLSSNASMQQTWEFNWGWLRCHEAQGQFLNVLGQRCQQFSWLPHQTSPASVSHCTIEQHICWLKSNCQNTLYLMGRVFLLLPSKKQFATLFNFSNSNSNVYILPVNWPGLCKRVCYFLGLWPDCRVVLLPLT